MVFAAFVFVSLRHGRRPPPPPQLDLKDQNFLVKGGKGQVIQFKKGKDDVVISFGNQTTYPDNR